MSDQQPSSSSSSSSASTSSTSSSAGSLERSQSSPSPPNIAVIPSSTSTSSSSSSSSSSNQLKIAIVGCAHGHLDEIYQSVKSYEAQNGAKIDLLICCGDFHAVRNAIDLNCLACPPKYRSMGTFYKYYSGEIVAPVLTLFIGGNHEASNHLFELYYGGWVAPNIYYLGQSGVVNFAGLRIAGLSGIFKPHDYRKGYGERLPYTQNELRSIFHTRSYEVFKLSQITKPIDIFLSHDWPRDITKYGDERGLLRRKSFLKEDIDKNRFGNPALRDLLFQLKPSNWFSAHMHVRFTAEVIHDELVEDRKPELPKEIESSSESIPIDVDPRLGSPPSSPSRTSAIPVTPSQSPPLPTLESSMSSIPIPSTPPSPSPSSNDRIQSPSPTPSSPSPSPSPATYAPLLPAVLLRASSSSSPNFVPSPSPSPFSPLPSSTPSSPLLLPPHQSHNRYYPQRAQGRYNYQQRYYQQQQQHQYQMPPQRHPLAQSQQFKTTKFLALDKCQPNKLFFEVLDFTGTGPKVLSYDEEWLAIIKLTHEYLNFTFNEVRLPNECKVPTPNGKKRLHPFSPVEEDIEMIRHILRENQIDRQIPNNFQQTVQVFHPNQMRNFPAVPNENPQTLQLLKLLDLPYKFPTTSTSTATPITIASSTASNSNAAQPAPQESNPEEIVLDDF